MMQVRIYTLPFYSILLTQFCQCIDHLSQTDNGSMLVEFIIYVIEVLSCQPRMTVTLYFVYNC